MRLRPRTKGQSRLAALTMWGPRTGSFVFIMAAAGLFILSTLNPASLQGVRTGAADMMAPVLAAVNSPIQKAADYVRAVTGLAALQAENARLQSENARLREWYRTALLMEGENRALKNLLNMAPEAPYGFVSARVIADSGNSYVKSLLVLAGRQQNVEKGQPVLAADGLIGRVIESGQRAARILLLTDINSRVPVQIQGRDVHAILGGNNDDRPILLHLPSDGVLEAGARVVTSGHGGLFPYGLPVGEVAFNEQGQPAVVPYASMERLTHVRIIDQAVDPHLRAGRLD